MKKGTAIVLALISMFIFTGCGGGDKKPAESTKQNAAQQTAVFEQVGYYKSKNNDRSFVIYTTAKTKDEMMKFAKTKAYTDGRVTNVHFFDNKEFALDNTLFKNHEAAMWLDCRELTNNHRKHMLGTCQRDITGNFSWYEKDEATKMK